MEENIRTGTVEMITSFIDFVVGKQITGIKKLKYVSDEAEWIIGFQLEFENCFLSIKVDSNHDDLIITNDKLLPEEDEVWEEGDIGQIWEKLIGKKLNFGWIGLNNKNYLDSIFFGFNLYHPSVGIVSVSSTLYDYEIIKRV